ncbi:MAG: SCO family protein [Woeseiaceae bacterium]|nr:SCO family protein [Woeseiaceae bacterium]
MTRQDGRQAGSPRLHRVLLAFLLAGLAGVAAAATGYERDDALDVSQAAIGRGLASHTLRDTDGQPFDLDRLRGKPLVISMIYTSCHHICPAITRNLGETIDVAREALGADAFTVVTVGFDWKVDTPERMRQFAAGLGLDDVSNWHFLATDAGAVDRLSDNLGFIFYPSAKGFDHLAQATVVDADGKIYRQVYGVDVATTALVEPLKELVFNTPRSAGFLEHWVSTFKLFCTVYDPNSDRYRFDYSIFMAIIVGVLSLGLVALFIVREWRHAR